MRGTIFAGLTLLVAALACAGGGRPDPVELRSIAEAVEHPDAEYLAFTARHSVEHMGSHEAKVYGSRRTSGTGRGRVSRTWIVPLVEADGTGHDPVVAWVHWNEPDGGSPEEGLRRLREEVDGKRVAMLAVYRAEEALKKRPAWGHALADALERHGLETHPQAPLFHLAKLIPMEADASIPEAVDPAAP